MTTACRLAAVPSFVSLLVAENTLCRFPGHRYGATAGRPDGLPSLIEPASITSPCPRQQIGRVDGVAVFLQGQQDEVADRGSVIQSLLL